MNLKPEQELRLECLKLAVQCGPNYLHLAGTFYQYVNKGEPLTGMLAPADKAT